MLLQSGGPRDHVCRRAFSQGILGVIPSPIIYLIRGFLTPRRGKYERGDFS